MKPVLLCLHGWGGSKEAFTELREALKGASLEILTPDLPGFGQEPEPPRPWDADDYADWVENWLRSQLQTADYGLRTLHLLGHSHGGRIAIKLATRGSGQLPKANCSISHLYLCAAAGIRHPRHFKRILGLILAKSGKCFLSVPGLRSLQPLARKLLYTLIRVHDYERASPLMQQTLIKITAEDLRPLLPKVSIPTDIFWGEDDGMTSLKDGELMHREIRGSRLHVFPGVRHRVHRDRAAEIAAVIRAHLDRFS